MPRSNKSGVSHAIRIPIKDANAQQEQVRIVEDSDTTEAEVTDVVTSEAEVMSSPGNSSSTSSAKRANTPKKSEKNPPPAPTTESH